MCFSAVCGLATSLPMLVGARLIQGLVSGPMMSVAQAILLRNYPIERRGMAIALWSMVIIIAPIFGPIIGGWITDNLSWPWLFYINLPVGAFSAVASWSILRHRESKKVKLPIDAVGLALLVVGVGSLQFMLDNGNEKDWFNSPLIVDRGIDIGDQHRFPHSLGAHRQASGDRSAFVRPAQFSRRHGGHRRRVFRLVRAST